MHPPVDIGSISLGELKERTQEFHVRVIETSNDICLEMAFVIKNLHCTITMILLLIEGGTPFDATQK